MIAGSRPTTTVRPDAEGSRKRESVHPASAANGQLAQRTTARLRFRMPENVGNQKQTGVVGA